MESEIKKITYRPDIDGLRAVAVTAVILYHAAVPGFGGGYVGVDVFFVISGYLITLLLIAASQATPWQRLTEFYIRRGRRILPALAIASLVAAAAAIVILLPLDLRRFGKYLAATPVFLTNVAAWREGGYFDAGVPNAGLMHFWSIAVEEQFYLVYPLILLVIARCMGRHRLLALAVLGGLSLALCLWASYHRPAANYYLAASRAWELLLGAIVACLAPRRLESQGVNELLAVASLVVIGLVVCFYRSEMQYPGLYTLAPCAATACLLAIGEHRSTFGGRLLSLRPLVFTGLISYSLYLWHWPVLFFFNYYHIEAAGALMLALLIVSLYVIAWASWRTVEKPFRNKIFLASNRSFLLAAAAANVFMLIVGVALWKSNGWPGRFAPDVQALASAKNGLHPDIGKCTSRSLDQIESGQLCSYGPDGEGLPRVLVWGDSHAMALLPAFEKLAWAHRMRLYFTATPACGPLLNVADSRRFDTRRRPCAVFNAAVVQAIQRIDPRLVILGGYWSYIDTFLLPQDDTLTLPDESVFKQGLERSVLRISKPGRSICLVKDVPTLKYPAPYALAMARRREIPDGFIGIGHAAALKENRNVERDIDALANRGLIGTVDLKDALCPADVCLFQVDGAPLYHDTNHLSVVGAEFVRSTLESCFSGFERF